MSSARAMERLRIVMLERGGLLGLATFAIYAWLAPAHIVDGDNAEFSTLGMTGGAAHPSGYPLYVLWLRAMQWLPGTTPAHTAAIATAIVGAASIVALQAACRAWGARPLAATLTAAVFAGAPLVIRSGTRAEVFALNNLVAAVVLWLSARGGPARGMRRASLLGLVAGLGVANHMTCTLLAPVGLLGVARGARETDGSRALLLVVAAASFLVGLVPYAYLLVAPDSVLSWGTVRSLDDLVAMVTRRDYGGPGAFLPTGVEIPVQTNFAALAATLGRTWLWLPLAVGLATLVIRVVRRGDGESRWAFGMLAVSWLVAGPLLSMKFNIEPSGLGLYVIQRFHVLPALLLAVPVAVGTSALLARITRTRSIEQAGCALVATFGFVACVALSLPHVARVHSPAFEHYIRNVMRSLPENAVMFAGQDGDYFGGNYLQAARGERPDVTIIAWQLTPIPWYGARMTRRGIYQPEGPEPPLVRVVDYLLSTGRPVLMEPVRTTSGLVARTHPTYPYGPLIRVLPRGSAVPPVEVVVAENKVLYERFDFGYPAPGPDDEFATAVHHRYAATWRTLARALSEHGKPDDAAWAERVARDLEPQP